MQIHIRRVLLLIIISILVLSGCTTDGIDNTQENNEKIENIQGQEEAIDATNGEILSQYTINVEFLPEEKIIKGTQTVVYTNNEEVELNNIYFHVYPNAFKERETLPFLFNDYVKAYPQGFSEGYIDIIEARVNGEAIDYIIEGSDSTILNIQLPQKLKPKENISIEFKYSIKIPPATERFGYGKNAYNIGNWYPVVAVYDESGWNLDPYYPIGDPFYTDVSDYNVTINSPKDYILAVTGEILSKEEVGNNINWNIEANLVRDFAWVASNEFEIVEEVVDGIDLKIYFLDDEETSEEIKEKVKIYSRDSINTFNRVIEKYPYSQLSIVQTNFPSGMEYPQIVFIGKEFYNNDYDYFLETIIVHEIAHQWWYGVVGNDQIDESWLDESLASYSEIIYYTENYGDREGEQYHQFENVERLDSYEDSLKEMPIIKSLDQFKDWDEYSLLTYTKGTVFLHSLKEKYGEDMFYKILNVYYNEYKFKIATTEDFLNVCEDVTGDELDSYFDKWLND